MYYLIANISFCYLSLISLYAANGEYFIDVPNCKLPDFNPFSKEALRVFKRLDQQECLKKPPLTSIVQDTHNDSVQIVLHRDQLENYLSNTKRDFNVSLSSL